MPKIPTYLAVVDYKPARGDLAAAGASGTAMARFGAELDAFGGKVAGYIKREETEAKKAEPQAGPQRSVEAQKTELARHAAQAQAENERSDATARYLDGLLDSTHRSVENFKSTDFTAARGGLESRIGQMQDDIASGIRDSEARRQFNATVQSLTDIQAPIVAGEQLHQLTDHARSSLPGNLEIYAKAATDARHPLEFDEFVDLAVREIRGKAETGFLTREEADQFEQGFYVTLAKRQAARAIEGDPRAALASLEGGEDFPALTETARARLIDQAGRAVRAQAVRQETESAAARRDLLARLPVHMESLRDGEPLDDEAFGRDRLIATFGEAEGAKLWTEIEQAKAAGAPMADVRWASRAEIAQRRAARESDPSPNEDAGALDLALARRDRQLQAKPADYVLANPRVAELHEAMVQARAQLEVPAAIAGILQAGQTATSGGPLAADLPSAQHRRDATADYANATLAEQERLGVPDDRRQVLPAATARDLAAQIAAGDPAEADKSLRDLAADWGDSWPRAFADLSRAGLPGELRLLAAVDTPITRQRFAKLLTAQVADPAALRAKAGDEGEAIDGLMPNMLVPVAISISDGTTILAMGSGGARSRSVHSQSAQSGTATPPATRPSTYRGDSYPRRNAVDLHDSDGKPVMSMDEKGNPQQVQVPEGIDLRMFARMGEEDNKLPGDIRGETIRKRLENFVQGGIWDLQRPRLQKDINGRYINYPEFVNAATLAIGIYCAAAGLTRQESLFLQRVYATFKSRFGDVKRSLSQYPLPERNVINTNLGYDLYAADGIPSPAE